MLWACNNSNPLGEYQTLIRCAKTGSIAFLGYGDYSACTVTYLEQAKFKYMGKKRKVLESNKVNNTEGLPLAVHFVSNFLSQDNGYSIAVKLATALARSTAKQRNSHWFLLLPRHSSCTKKSIRFIFQLPCWVRDSFFYVVLTVFNAQRHITFLWWLLCRSVSKYIWLKPIVSRNHCNLQIWCKCMPYFIHFSAGFGANHSGSWVVLEVLADYFSGAVCLWSRGRELVGYYQRSGVGMVSWRRACICLWR